MGGAGGAAEGAGGWGKGKRVGGGRLDELKIQLSTEHSIDALLIRTFTGRYLNVRRIESKTRGNT